VITVGIDIGTSGVKVALVRDGDEVLAHSSQPLSVSRPQPGFSEQHPEHWWLAACNGLDDLKAQAPQALADVTAIGLSGQMHGATLLDAHGAVLRPCILWNDGRSDAECDELERDWPALRRVTGNIAMPGFTAPKLCWVRKHEPEVFARTAKVLLPKAYLRWRLSGEYAEDLSDASGTLWLDVGARRWSPEALAACHMSLEQMPRLVEGSEPAGVLWATTARFAPNPAHAVHAFCHAVPDTWHQMGVLLAAASSLAWWAGVCGRPEAELLGEIDAASVEASPAWFAPYLSGERTPHNDTRVRGGFLGLAADTTRAELTQAVLEGVSYAMADARDALAAAGTTLHEAALIGGGARSPRWAQLMADVLGVTLHQVAESDIGCALGAARLARMAAGDGIEVARPARRLRTYDPRPSAVALHRERHARWQRLYPLARDFTR